MMLGITMRMTRKEYPGGDVEMRNAIACDWPRFMERALPYMPCIFLPNSGKAVIDYAERLGVDALLLTGGDDWGIFPERDETEKSLFFWAREKNYPVLGICRGAQIINKLLGGHCHACKGHVATRHAVDLRLRYLPDKAMVNSFHNHCIAGDELAQVLEPFAVSEDCSVEGFFGDKGKICGIVWHPERENMPSAIDMALVRNFFGGNIQCRKMPLPE